MIEQAINDELEKLTPEQHDKMLDMFKAALIETGARHVSIYLLTHKHEESAMCSVCQKWWALSELRTAGKCPDCGATEDFCTIEPD